MTHDQKEKPPSLVDYITAGQASAFLTEKLKRPISNQYVHKLSTRAKNKVRSVQVGNRWVYHRGDIENVEIRQRTDNAETAE